MKKKMFSNVIAVLMCFIMVLSVPMVSMAKMPSQGEMVEPQLSYNFSTTPFAGTQASWYNVYKGTDNRSQALDATFVNITTTAMALIISRIVGLSSGSITIRNAADVILGVAISEGFGSSSNLYYTVAHYQNKNNAFQEKRVIKYYADQSHNTYLYSQTVYAEKVPLS